MQFGKAMRAMMAIRGMSQKELVRQTGISRLYISLAGSGRVNLKREQEDKIRMELCWPKEIDHLLDKVEGFQYER